MLFLLSLSAFGQPAGLSFYGRYLSDAELDALPNVKVTIPFYNDFEHEVLTSEDDYSFFLNTYFDYKKRHFLVQEDAAGTQWMHLSSRGSAERINATSKYAKSQVNNRVFYDFEKPMAISFDWCAKISNSPKKNASITVVKITATSQTPNPVPAYIVCTDNTLYLKVKEYDLRESYEARSTTGKIKLCPYEYGKIAHIRLEMDGNKVSAFVDGEKKGEYLFAHELWGKFQFKMSSAQEHFGDFFNEAFFGNIEVGEITAR